MNQSVTIDQFLTFHYTNPEYTVADSPNLKRSYIPLDLLVEVLNICKWNYTYVKKEISEIQEFQDFLSQNRSHCEYESIDSFHRLK